MNHFLRFRIASVSSLALLAAAGCNMTEGADDKADFSYDSLGPMSSPLAAGASDGISISVPSGLVVDHAGTSDPSVLALGTMTSSAAGSYDVPVTAGKPGSATLSIYDSTGKVIDLTTVQVAATTSIPLSAPNGVTILEGQTFAVHATTLGAGGVTLAGVGAIHFTYGGALAPSTQTWGLCSGDCASFVATSAGTGQIDVSSVSASETLQLAAVSTSQIDSFGIASPSMQVAHGASASTAYTLKAAGTVVQANGTELTCTSSEASVASAAAAPVGTLGASATSGSVLVSATAAGHATITCTAGSQRATIDVTVQ